MKEPKASIFNLARTAPAHSPLRDLLQELEQFRPPEESAALLQAEAARRAAGIARDDASKALNALCAIARNDGQSGKRVSAAELLAAQAHLATCDGRLETAKESEGRVSLEWRRQYTTQVFDLVAPARVALHNLIGEIEAAMTLFDTLARRATAASAGSPRILQEAPTMLDHLRIVREFIDVDRRILP